MNFFQDLKQVFEKGVEQVGNQSPLVKELARLSGLLKGKKESIQDSYNRLGQLVYKEWEKKQKIEITDEIRELLKSIQDVERQATKLANQVDSLKSSVDHIDQKQQPIPTNSPLNSSPSLANLSPKTPDAILYLCPFCAHQVKEDASVCPNCQVRFY
ncbi:hypothetical protein [Thermoflavimicrobium daqui]|uniref:Uncharacterized protein n=1 Tax=Thermoflavimicrobium daqui TaxID=2137476 RepID=A0A364K5V1_9BACL|nr:hypothetical protein [Thermoflavimicrobium daqui]RAL25689.1 hypothetical protein DL897_06330 [Thermoflavimicrobium daqui]